VPLLRSASHTFFLYSSSSFDTSLYALQLYESPTKHVTSTQGMYQALGRRVTWKSNAELFACTVQETHRMCPEAIGPKSRFRNA
jgi:hypothetical protein